MVKTLVNNNAFNASKTGFISYGKLFKAVAEEVGMARALELHGSVYTGYGHEFEEMFREQSLDEVGKNIGAMLEAMGYETEISLTEDCVVVNTRLCPEYEGFKEAGFDHETIKKLCLGSIGSIDATLRKLGSSGGVRVSKYRSDSDDYCIEEFKVK